MAAVKYAQTSLGLMYVPAMMDIDSLLTDTVA